MTKMSTIYSRLSYGNGTKIFFSHACKETTLAYL